MATLVQKLTMAFGLLALAACGDGNFQTNYAEVPPGLANSWTVTSMTVQVPDTLVVSEENTFAPNADIVWREDPFGNRREQVREIMDFAIGRALGPLQGPRDVTMTVVVTRFHALTERTRYQLNISGIHDITFFVQIFDAETQQPLIEPTRIQADLVALTGKQAIDAERRGFTQKVRISNHVTNVMAAWLGYGPDQRGKINNRLGR